jgi:hypothetical protein
MLLGRSPISAVIQCNSISDELHVVYEDLAAQQPALPGLSSAEAWKSSVALEAAGRLRVPSLQNQGDSRQPTRLVCSGPEHHGQHEG